MYATAPTLADSAAAEVIGTTFFGDTSD